MADARDFETLKREIAWFQVILAARVPQLGVPAEDSGELAPPPHPGAGRYGDLCRRFEFNPAERLVLILALLPYVAPHVLDPLLVRNAKFGRRFTEVGGDETRAGFLPTVQTALFLLAGHDLARRVPFHTLFAAEHPFQTQGILALRGEEAFPSASPLRLSPRYREFLTGGEYRPGGDLPAQRMTTALEWEDLVLDAATREQVDAIVQWSRHAAKLLEEWKLAPRLGRGYRAVFCGPPGTGKRLTACLLGKVTGRDVYRIDPARLPAGEADAALGRLLDEAARENWILFLDDDGRDRAANQQLAYLLQRIEDFPGVVILASNLRNRIDEAYARRFQAVIHFAMPDAAARLRLWQDAFRNNAFRLGDGVDLALIAEKYEISGGSIGNVLRFAALAAAERDPPVVALKDLLTAIRQETQKGAPEPL